MATLVLEDLLVVSIGDSAASGQGNPDVPGSPEGFDIDAPWWVWFIPGAALYLITKEAFDWASNQLKRNLTTISRAGGLTIDMDPKPVWLEPFAYRSLRSGHAHAAKLIEDRAKGTVVTFLPFGRTGSEIPEGLIGPRTSNGRRIDQWVGNVGQIEEVARTVGTRQIDALLIYIGVNDMGVAASLKELVAGDSPILGSGDPTQTRLRVKAEGERKLAELPSKFRDLADALKVLNVRQVYLTEYPTGLFDDKNGNDAAGCGLFSGPQLNLSRRDAELIKDLAEQLNKVLKNAAKEHGWVYVSGVATAFKGHGYCTGGRRYFVQAEESLVLQGDTEGTIHPNPVGHTKVAALVAKSVQKNTVDAPRPSRAVAPQGPVLGVAAAGPPGTAGIPGRARPTPRRRVRSR
jgi:hypothetical protein